MHDARGLTMLLVVIAVFGLMLVLVGEFVEAKPVGGYENKIVQLPETQSDESCEG